MAIWDVHHVPMAPGLILKDGERFGMLFPTGKLFFATYSQIDDSVIWEDDGNKHKMCEEYLWAITRWLEK